jgi:hypothetical protein
MGRCEGENGDARVDVVDVEMGRFGGD